MADITELPKNLITPEDQEKLESFGGHEIAHGRMTRYCWSKTDSGDPAFDMFRGGAHEEFIARITHSFAKHEYRVTDKNDMEITSGRLEHIMAVLEEQLKEEHGETAS